jgi:hypothetical protein
MPAANYPGYQEQQRLEDAFGRAVRDFVARYPNMSRPPARP